MEVTLQGVSFWDSSPVQTGGFLSTAEGKPTKVLLGAVSVKFSAGTLSALYGYGSGPSSLLNLVSLRYSGIGHLAGSILFDNSVRSAGSYCDIAVVSNRNLNCFLDLSVFEYLFWSARLRVPHGSVECR